MLQTRNGKRTGQAAVRIAVEMVEEGLIDKPTALTRVPANDLDQLLHPSIDPDAEVEVIAQGCLLPRVPLSVKWFLPRSTPRNLQLLAKKSSLSGPKHHQRISAVWMPLRGFSRRVAV